jgi:hypothetical protein
MSYFCIYLQESNNLTAAGREGSQYAKNAHRLNPDQARIPIPPDKKIMDIMVSRLRGS